MKSNPARIVVAVADALFEVEDSSRDERLTTLTKDVLAFAAATSFATRTTFALSLWFLWIAPVVFFLSWRPFTLLDRGRRREVLTRLERSPLGLLFVPWRTLLVLRFYEDERELARIGYRDERKRHLALLPEAETSGVRLRGDAELAAQADEDDEAEKGAA